MSVCLPRGVLGRYFWCGDAMDWRERRRNFVDCAEDVLNVCGPLKYIFEESIVVVAVLSSSSRLGRILGMEGLSPRKSKRLV